MGGGDRDRYLLLMTKPLVQDMKSVVLTCENPDVTAAFYRDVLCLPLESEQHRGTIRHWACQLGSMHFAIHAREGFWLPTTNGPQPATIVSFTVEDLDALREHLRARNVEVMAEQRIGPMRFVALRDPDGRHVCCGTRWPGGAT
jgi:catechol 2,3-dioxygenase-like lactoylglutathione lyase family enzyme